MSRLTIVPLDLSEANELVSRWHRHHQPVIGHKFSIGVIAADGGGVCGAAIIGRPVARHYDDGWTMEVTRCVTDGTQNACSALYGAAWRIAREMGYRRLITYTLASEDGGSLRGAGWKCLGKRGYDGKSWNCPSRPRVQKAPTAQKYLWEVGAEG